MYLLNPTVAARSYSSIVKILGDRALYQSHDTAYVYLINGETDLGVSLTYGELDQKARSLGSLLYKLGLTGTRVLLMYPPGIDFIIAFFGCLYAGVVAVPAYPPRKNQSLDRLISIVADCDAKQILTTAVVWQSLEKSLANYPELTAMRWLASDNLISSLIPHKLLPEIKEDSLAFLQYTSGSTGAPKGVMVSHGNLLHNQQMIQKALGHSEKTTHVSWLPLFHDMGLIGNVLQSLYNGTTCIQMSPVDFLQKPVRWLQAISRYRATTSGGPNFAYELCASKITAEEKANLDLSSWQVAFNGSEPIRAETLERFSQAFADSGFSREAFYPCYGMAEATLFITGGTRKQEPVIEWVDEQALQENQIVATSAEVKGTRALVGVGKVWLDQKIRIVDPQSFRELANGRVGEIWVAGASVAAGYWNQPEKTAETFNAYLNDTGEGPFLRTGDLGCVNSDGELFITGRIKDTIIIRGRNHHPQDIELTVEQSHPALRSGCVAAFGVDVNGQEKLVVVAEVERSHLRRLNVTQVVSNIRASLSKERGLQVQAVALLKTGSIPKTSSGKIQRFACRHKFLTGDLEDLASDKVTSGS